MMNPDDRRSLVGFGSGTSRKARANGDKLEPMFSLLVMAWLDFARPNHLVDPLTSAPRSRTVALLAPDHGLDRIVRLVLRDGIDLDGREPLALGHAAVVTEIVRDREGFSPRTGLACPR